jgi:hypothetical protein
MSTVTSPSLGKQLAPVNLKQKIIAGEYIDLALLLINSQASLSDNHYILTITLGLLLPKNYLGLESFLHETVCHMLSNHQNTV